jgi:hypothetical protein
MSAPATATVEAHHNIPHCLLRLRDRAYAAGFTGEGIELAMEFEHEARRFGADPDISRDEPAALVEGSAVELPADEHRDGRSEARDFARWGRRGDLATVRGYGTAWFSLLARRRWERIIAEALAKVLYGRVTPGPSAEDQGFQRGGSVRALDCRQPHQAPSYMTGSL